MSRWATRTRALTCLRPFEYPPPDGYETPEHPLIGVDRHFRLTAAVQTAYPELAVVGSGYSWLQAYAFEAGAANVAAGRATFVGIGRGALTQPDFGRRLGNAANRSTASGFAAPSAIARP